MLVEKGAGEKAFFSDQAYVDAGATVVSRDDAVSKANLIAVVNQPGNDNADDSDASSDSDEDGDESIGEGTKIEDGDNN